jgi:putative DNA primase/helicase
MFACRPESGFDRVKAMAAGQWASIIETLYPQIAKATYRPGIDRCACPNHHSTKGAKADGFRVFRDFNDTGGAVCNTCGTFPTGIDLICFLDGQEGNPVHALRVLEGYFGLSNRKAAPVMAPPKPKLKPVYDERTDPVAIKRRMKVLAEIWGQSLPLSELKDDHQAIRYFRETRGIDDLAFIRNQKNMRFHPHLFYARSDIEGHPAVHFPAIISMMHGFDGRPVALHRIYLDEMEPKKAPVDKNKKILARVEAVLNGTVRVQGRVPFGSHANVCEGVETGMAIGYSTGQPMYVAGYATLMAAWKPPAGIRCVTIWADRDANEAGQRHALLLKTKLENDGYMCRVLIPNFLEKANEDWNDVLLTSGFGCIVDAYSGVSTKTETV